MQVWQAGWKTKPAMVKEFVFGGPGVTASLTVCWLALTTQRHSARLSACQAQRAAARPNQRALIQPATGSPLRPFFFQALPVATTTPPHLCVHTHTPYTMQALIMTNLPKANLPSF